MDISLGVIELTEKQISRLNDLKTDNIKGFSYWHDKKEVVVVSDTAVDETALKAALLALPDEYSKEYYENSFSFKVLMGRLNQTMEPVSILKLSPYVGAMESFCEWKNWDGIKAFLDGLVTAEIATAEEVSQVIDAFLEQGIDLAGGE
jgi:hypothetical protein